MGDRANIVVYDPFGTPDGETVQNPQRDAVFLYGHWSGSEMPSILKAGLVRGEERWDDGPYLARILFQEMVGTDRDLTGYGISTRMTDNEHPLLVVDVPRQVIVEYPESVYVQHGFSKLASYRGSAFAKYSGKWKRNGGAE